MQKMTAEEYLEKRGWLISRDDVGSLIFADPRGSSDDALSKDAWGWCGIECALVVQRSRDEAEERKAWLSLVGFSGDVWDNVRQADALLCHYRDRFAVEVVDSGTVVKVVVDD